MGSTLGLTAYVRVLQGPAESGPLGSVLCPPWAYLKPPAFAFLCCPPPFLAPPRPARRRRLGECLCVYLSYFNQSASPFCLCLQAWHKRTWA